MDISDNDIGQLVLPEGWKKRAPLDEEERKAYGKELFVHCEEGKEGWKQWEHPGTREGVIALAAGLSESGAITSLDISANNIGADGVKHIADVGFTRQRYVPAAGEAKTHCRARAGRMQRPGAMMGLMGAGSGGGAVVLLEGGYG